MHDQFTPGAIKVMIQAQQEAKSTRQPEVDTGEILVALFADEGSIAVQALHSHDIGIDAARQSLKRIRGIGSGSPAGAAPLTFHGKKLMEKASEIASAQGKKLVDTDHMLLAILKTEQFAAMEILQELAASPADVRISVLAAVAAKRTIAKPGLGDPNECIAALAAERSYLIQKLEHSRRKIARLEQDLAKQKAFTSKVRALFEELN